MELIINDKLRKNNYKNLKKYRDNKNVILKTYSNDNLEKAFVKAYNEKNFVKRYNFIYDYICDYLNKNINVLCDFKNDKCIANRLGLSSHSTNGCCYYRNEVLCHHLKNKKNVQSKIFHVNYLCVNI